MSHGVPRLDVGHLHLVDAITRAGTVTRAAGLLGVTQSAVSHRLGELEGRLGVALFRRSGRRMLLTPEGRRVLDTARRVLADLDQIEGELTQVKRGARGRIRVATECYFCYSWLPATLQRFRSTRPLVEIQIVPEVTRDPIAALLDRTLDVAIVHSLPDDRRLVTHELFQDELVAVVPRTHRLARKPFLTAADFAGQTIACHFAEGGRGLFEREVLDPAGVRPAAVLELQVTAAVLEVVAAGMGLSVLPRWALTVAGGPNLATVRITRGGLFRSWHAAVLADQAASPAIASLLEMLVEYARPVTASRDRQPAAGKPPSVRRSSA